MAKNKTKEFTQIRASKSAAMRRTLPIVMQKAAPKSLRAKTFDFTTSRLAGVSPIKSRIQRKYAEEKARYAKKRKGTAPAKTIAKMPTTNPTTGKANKIVGTTAVGQKASKG